MRFVALDLWLEYDPYAQKTIHIVAEQVSAVVDEPPMEHWTGSQPHRSTVYAGAHVYPIRGTAAEVMALLAWS